MHSMYSLYRAWLMRDALSLGGGPLPTGPSASPMPVPCMSGAPNVVVQVGPTLTHFSAHRAVLAAHSGYFKAALATDAGPISIPNINVDEFSSLLTFMYTGYLDLNLNNIYNILLATHVLHMPRALELCREFLIRNPPTMEPTMGPSGHSIIKPIPSRKYLPQVQQQFYQPIVASLHSSETTPFRPVGEKPAECSGEPVASTSRQTPSPILNPCDDASSEQKITKSERKSRKRPTEDGKSDDKVVIDIACCDGPVRFHRVVNNSYGMTHTDTEYKAVDSNEAMNKVMNANIRDKKLNPPDENSQSESFTCVYCNHTFKSQYCYQKHARRHINPVTLEVKNCQHENTSSGKREVKLLDMNVQYYPCKTCGSKFPSYYFVHKHRKMCHNEEMERNNEKPPQEEKTDS